MEIHIFKQYKGIVLYCIALGTLCKTNKTEYFSLPFDYNNICGERKRQVAIEQTRFLSIAFLCSKFKQENIYSGVNFLREKCLQ